MSKISKFLPILLLSFALAGCQTADAPLQVSTKPIELTVMQPIDPEPVRMQDVTWRVVTKENVNKFIDEQVKQTGNVNPVFVVISMKDYQALSLNLADLKRYIDQQKQIILYYRKATGKKPADAAPAAN